MTARGYEMEAIGGKVFDKLRRRWQRQIGREQVAAIEEALLKLREG